MDNNQQIFTPLKREKLSEEVVKQIKILISEKKLNPGDRLPSERKLADYFEVGRPTIREALQKLKNIGLVETKVGDGTYIKNIDAESYIDSVIESIELLTITNIASFEELWEVRNILEVSIAELAAENASNEEIEKMESVIFHAENILNKKEEYSEDALEFHSLLSKSTHNKIIIFIFDSLKKMLKQYFEYILEAPQATQKSIKFHKKILNAIKEKDPIKARNIMKEHLEVVYKESF
ncbi:MAG: FadR/GntR family transcriptional regulator [Candidatus Woesearchaeota archaeon]